MSEHFDAAVLGMGPGGEVAAGRLLKAGLRVAVIERELIGGECAYWACIPSKTLLRPPEARTEADRAAGVTGAGLDWAQASDYRDYMIRHLDDHAQITGYERHGATVVKAEATLAGPGRIRAGDREIIAEHIIVATGSDPVIPRVEGAEDIAVWTNREAFTATALPEQAVIVGGSAVGTETATFLARFGVQVTLVHRGERLMEREDPRVGQLAQAHLEEAGITVRLNATAARVRKDSTGPLVDLDDGTTVPAQVLMVAGVEQQRNDQSRLGSFEWGLPGSGQGQPDNSENGSIQRRRARRTARRAPACRPGGGTQDWPRSTVRTARSRECRSLPGLWLVRGGGSLEATRIGRSLRSIRRPVRAWRRTAGRFRGSPIGHVRGRRQWSRVWVRSQGPKVTCCAQCGHRTGSHWHRRLGRSPWARSRSGLRRSSRLRRRRSRLL